MLFPGQTTACITPKWLDVYEYFHKAGMYVWIYIYNIYACIYACMFPRRFALLVRCPSRVCACPPAVHHHTYLLSPGYISCMYVCWTPCVYASTALCLFVRYFPAYNTRVLSHYYSITTRNTIHRAMSARYSCAQATISHFQTFRR